MSRSRRVVQYAAEGRDAQTDKNGASRARFDEIARGRAIRYASGSLAPFLSGR
jgi:hypothetical protein